MISLFHRLVLVGLALAAGAPGLAADAAGISWVVPEEGGTPRDPARIEAMAAAEFRIRARAEEPRSPLKHAVSRVDLVCRNSGKTPAPVTVHLDLSGDGQRTLQNQAAHGGMGTRDFLFISPPGQPWRQVDGTVQDWTATITFVAEPGDTRVGLSPWYTYSDLLEFLRRLPASPHLRQDRIARSDDGRDQWELTITDPTVAPEGKLTIYWHAREHAYETFSSFAMEGLIPYLLSPAAADFRRRYVFVLHPMTNVDGVARGYEYRSGYDYPDPRGTVTGRITFETIDRLKPAYCVSWHNWIAPRDRDDVSYTDMENGAMSARGWYLFTQRFPSLRRSDHHWREESNPVALNWKRHPVLNVANHHQYAMKHYGSQVWGWEMPWWRRTPDEARELGAAFAPALLATLDDLRAGRKLPAPVAEAATVARGATHEFVRNGRAHVTNPFRDAAFVGEFKSPSGKLRSVEGFFDGGDTWRLRFAPDEEGDWSYRLRGEGVELYETGRLRCTPATTRGLIGRHPENPAAFAYRDGTPFFPMGDTVYGLYDDTPITPARRAEYLATRRALGFNFVRMQVRQSQQRPRTDPAFWPWGGTPDQPDLDRYNPAFFRGFDQLVVELREAGMNLELILLNFYAPPMNDPVRWTPARERQWLRYLLARYAASDNIFLWTIANEYETHPDGKYRLDRKEDVAWARETARYLKAQDPYGHLVTVHPVFSASAKGTSPRDAWEPPFQVGPFFGDEPAIDVLTHQTSLSPDGATWDAQLEAWRGDDPHLAAAVRADRRYGKPVLNSEFGYEAYPGSPTHKKQVHATDRVRHAAWQIVCAGGYIAAGFTDTIGHSDTFNRIDREAAGRYDFRVHDAGAGQQLAALYRFFTALPFWRMQPIEGVRGPALALGSSDSVVLYFTTGGSASVEVPAALRGGRGRWFDPRSGAFSGEARLTSEARQTFIAPDTADWVLLLDRAP